MGIEQCALELVQQIASELSTADILALQTTSKFIKSATEYMLYKTIKWVFHFPSTPRAPIHLLLRTLLERPELGCLIQCIDFYQKGSFHPIWAAGQPRLTDEELERLAQKARNKTEANTKPEKWLEQ